MRGGLATTEEWTTPMSTRSVCGAAGTIPQHHVCRLPHHVNPCVKTFLPTTRYHPVNPTNPTKPAKPTKKATQQSVGRLVGRY